VISVVVETEASVASVSDAGVLPVQDAKDASITMASIAVRVPFGFGKCFMDHPSFLKFMHKFYDAFS
jgi:hypothetical protein